MKTTSINLLLFFVSLIVKLPTYAQETSALHPANHTGTYLVGGLGPAIPLGEFGKERESGLDLNMAMEYRLKSRFLVRGMVDFSSFKFKPGAISQQLENENFAVGGSNDLISLFVSGGYYVPLGRFTPYGFLGIGSSFVSSPAVDLDLSGNVLDIDQEIGTYFSHVTGLGLDFALNPLSDKEIANNVSRTIYLIYFESFYTRIPGNTDISDHDFNLLSLNLGIKTRF